MIDVLLHFSDPPSYRFSGRPDADRHGDISSTKYGGWTEWGEDASRISTVILLNIYSIATLTRFFIVIFYPPRFILFRGEVHHY